MAFAARKPVHRSYAGYVHARMKRTGHFWQGRFGCAAMDEGHCAAAVRYIAMNPVRAGLTEHAADWPWSSTRALLGRADDGMTACEPVRERIPDLAGLFEAAEDEDRTMSLRRAETVGRPIGSAAWLEQLEQEYGRTLRPRKRGRKSDKILAVSP